MDKKLMLQSTRERSSLTRFTLKKTSPGCGIMVAQDLRQVLEKIYQERGFDFRQYKESSLRRRIERRLRATRVVLYEEYVKILEKDPGEYSKLLAVLTIQVTEFFRDPEAWLMIREKVLPEIIQKKIENQKGKEAVSPILRIWSAGCATGEEVYSVAILLEQLLGEREDDVKIDICGTDIDKEILLKAQKGEYKSDMTKSLPQEILNKYFDTFDGAKPRLERRGLKAPLSINPEQTPGFSPGCVEWVDSNGHFRVRSLLGEKVHFKFHDLVLNEPLRPMDLILCRNVAIYFQRPLQEKIFMDFYNALNETGYLFLGKAETLIGPAQEKFKVIDKRWKIYQKEER